MTDRQLEHRSTVLSDAARVIRLLAAVRLAVLLEDDNETGRLTTLLEQVTLEGLNALAHELELEATRSLRPAPGISPSPGAGEDEGVLRVLSLVAESDER